MLPINRIYKYLLVQYKSIAHIIHIQLVNINDFSLETRSKQTNKHLKYVSNKLKHFIVNLIVPVFDGVQTHQKQFIAFRLVINLNWSHYYSIRICECHSNSSNGHRKLLKYIVCSPQFYLNKQIFQD